MLPAEPKNWVLPKAKMPPSLAPSQYPSLQTNGGGGGGGATCAALSRHCGHGGVVPGADIGNDATWPFWLTMRLATMSRQPTPGPKSAIDAEFWCERLTSIGLNSWLP